MSDRPIKVGDRVLAFDQDVNQYILGIVINVMEGNNAIENGPKKFTGFCEIEWMSERYSKNSNVQGMYTTRILRDNYEKAIKDGII